MFELDYLWRSLLAQAGVDSQDKRNMDISYSYYNHIRRFTEQTQSYSAVD